MKYKPTYLCHLCHKQFNTFAADETEMSELIRRNQTIIHFCADGHMGLANLIGGELVKDEAKR